MYIFERIFRSIRLKLWFGFGIVLLVTNILMAGAFILITNRIEIDNVTKNLDVAIKTAWNQFYARSFQLQGIQCEAAHSPKLIDNVGKKNAAALQDNIVRWQFSYPFVDFWLITDTDGYILSRSGPRNMGEKWQLADLINASRERKDSIISTELIPRSVLVKESPNLALKAEVPIDYHASEFSGNHFNKKSMTDGLVNIVVSPIMQNEQVYGFIVGGFLLNNDAWIPREYTQKVPNTYLSIGVNGVRVSSNIETNELSQPPGSIQEEPLIKATAMNQRYRGSIYVNGKFSLIAVDPILNHRGEVVGNIGVGAPINMFVALNEQIVIIIAICFIVFVIAMALAEIIGTNIIKPILQLKSLATSVTERSVEPEDMVWKDTQAPSEITNLASTIIEMAKTLQQKEHEIKIYAEQLLEEKGKLESKVHKRTQELAETVSQLQQTNQYKSQFLANMSHELRTPLNAIIGFSELLKDQVAGELNAKQQWYAQNILTTGYQLLDLINDILDVVRIEQGKDKVSFEYVRVDELVDSIVMLLQKQAEEKAITVSSNIESGLPDALWDRNKIRQILLNLLANAVKFTLKGGKVIISAARKEDNILFTVSDTGIGIKQEDHARVFMAFEQAESSYTRQFQGVGLGLSISKKLTELHGGKIWLESEQGIGTTVFVLLPIKTKIMGDDLHANPS